MSSIKLSPNASGTGEFTIAAPNSNTNRTLTLPDNTGTILTTGTAGVPVNGPAFRAFLTNTQTFSNSTWTKVQLNNETFDTASCFDSTTNYRFTPTVAGYYQVNAVCAFNGSSSGFAATAVYKNGANTSQGCSTPNNTTFGGGSSVSDVLYMNGSTDYIEMYANQVSGSNLTLQTTSNATFFSASLVRSA